MKFQKSQIAPEDYQIHKLSSPQGYISKNSDDGLPDLFSGLHLGFRLHASPMFRF